MGIFYLLLYIYATSFTLLSVCRLTKKTTSTCILEGHPAQQGRTSKVLLAKVEGMTLSSDSQQDLTSGMLKVNSSAQREWVRQEDAGRESCWAPEDRDQPGWGTKALASAISLSHPPAEIPKGTSSCHWTCLHHANTQCCASVDLSLPWVGLPSGVAGPFPQGTTEGKAS